MLPLDRPAVRVASTTLLLGGTLTLAACGGGGSAGTPSSSSSTPVAATTKAAAPAPTTSVSSATRATPKPSSTGISLTSACLSANSAVNSVTTTWNRAVRSQLTDDLNSAGRGFATTAKGLRMLAAKVPDAGFAARVRSLATDGDKLATARAARQTVDPRSFNNAAHGLTTYCNSKLS